MKYKKPEKEKRKKTKEKKRRETNKKLKKAPLPLGQGCAPHQFSCDISDSCTWGFTPCMRSKISVLSSKVEISSKSHRNFDEIPLPAGRQGMPPWASCGPSVGVLIVALSALPIMTLRWRRSPEPSSPTSCFVAGRCP